MIEVRCCCKPENLLGWLPEATDTILNLREMDNGEMAYESHGHTVEEIEALPGFVAVGRKPKRKKIPKRTWRR